MQDDSTIIGTAPRTRRRGGAMLWVAVLGLVIGAAAVGALYWNGTLDRYVPRPNSIASSQQRTGFAPALQSGSDGSSPVDAVGSLENRLALLEDRFSRVSFAADGAAGNAARAEALLIASAARRLIDRGEQLGFVADQLRLRFADAQPNAVAAIVDFAKSPVTIDELSARLEALSPDLTNTSEDLTLWERFRQEFTGLFIVHRDSSTLLAPRARIERARLMLSAGRIAEAIDEVERLPGVDHADKWMDDAHRYETVQRALDLIETTAMLEPQKLKDGTGRPVEQSSPIAAPAPASTPSVQPSADPTPAADASDSAQF